MAQPIPNHQLPVYFVPQANDPFGAIADMFDELINTRTQALNTFAQAKRQMHVDLAVESGNLVRMRQEAADLQQTWRQIDTRAQTLINSAKNENTQLLGKIQHLNEIGKELQDLINQYNLLATIIKIEQVKRGNGIGILFSVGLMAAGLAALPMAPLAFGVTLYGSGVDGLMYALEGDGKMSTGDFFRHIAVGTAVSLVTGNIAKLAGPIKHVAKKALFQGSLSTLGTILKKGMRGQPINWKDCVIPMIGGAAGSAVRSSFENLIGKTEGVFHFAISQAAGGAIYSATYTAIGNGLEGKPLTKGVVRAAITAGALELVNAIPEAIKAELVQADLAQLKEQYESQESKLADEGVKLDQEGREVKSAENITEIAAEALNDRGYVTKHHKTRGKPKDSAEYLRRKHRCTWKKGNQRVWVTYKDGKVSYSSTNPKILTDIKNVQNANMAIHQTKVHNLNNRVRQFQKAYGGFLAVAGRDHSPKNNHLHPLVDVPVAYNEAMIRRVESHVYNDLLTIDREYKQRIDGFLAQRESLQNRINQVVALADVPLPQPGEPFRRRGIPDWGRWDPLPQIMMPAPMQPIYLPPPPPVVINLVPMPALQVVAHQPVVMRHPVPVNVKYINQLKGRIAACHTAKAGRAKKRALQLQLKLHEG